MAKLRNDEIRSIISARLSRSLDGTDSELRSDRENALNFYFGRPLGNEIDGRAQVVSRDVMTTIKWMMPSLMRSLSGPEVFKFDPIGPQDIDQAKQESEYVRAVLFKHNPGWLLMYDWIMDGLMQKVGYAHYYWQEQERLRFDEYTGLTEDQLVMTLLGLDDQGDIMVMGAEQSEEDGTWSLKLRRRNTKGCAKWEVYPPDEVIVDKDCDGDIKRAKFVGHMRRGVTRGELVEQGFNRKRVERLTSYSWREETEERRARDTVNESDSDTQNEGDSDWASQELQLFRCWTYLDVDGDGIAELRYFYLAGDDILVNEEAPEIPWESLAPDRVPHRHTGLSVYDVIEEIQRIQTALKRGLLDNTYYTMNPRVAFDRNIVDWKMLGVNRPGGHVAVNGSPATALFPIPTQPMQDRILPVIEHFDQTRETRMGVGRMTMGLDADTLAKATKGAYMNAQTQSAQLLEIMAEILANSGIGSLYNSMRNLLMRHQYKPAQYQQGKQWAWINPAEWPERETMTVTPGAASKEEIGRNLATMATAQQQAAQVPGLVQPQNVYALAMEFQACLGFEGKSFFTDPASPEYEQWQQQQAEKAKNAPPDPYLQAEQMKAQQRAQESQTNAQLQAQKLGVETGLKIADMELKYATDLAAPGIGAELGTNGRGGDSAGAARSRTPARPAPG